MALKCSFEGCTFRAETPQGLGRHQRWHVDSGQAEYVPSENGGIKTLRKLDVPRSPDFKRYGQKKNKGKSNLACPLKGCGYIAPNATGLGAHTRGHVHRGEAKLEGDVLVPTGLPLRPTRKYKKSLVRKQHLPLAITGAEVPLAAVEVHSCTATRAVNRLADAMVLMNVSTLLEEHDPSEIMQVLAMVPRLRERAR